MNSSWYHGATENLLKQKWIREISGEDKHRRVYTLTGTGRDVLKLDMKSLLMTYYRRSKMKN